MAQQVNVSITLEDGKSIHPFTKLNIFQRINEHSRFDFRFPADILEGKETSIIKASKTYIGKTVSIELSDKSEGSEVNSFKGIIVDIKLTKSYVCVIFNDSIKLFKINKLQELKTFDKFKVIVGGVVVVSLLTN